MSRGVNQSSLFKCLLLQNCLKINDTTLFHLISAGPQKPQLTASKIKYEKFGRKILIPYWKIDILVP